MVGVRASNIVVALIGKKALETGEKDVINYVQVDAQLLRVFFTEVPVMIQVPIVVGVSFVSLFYLIGPSFLAGIGVFGLSFLLNLGVSHMIESSTSRIMEVKDRRMAATQDSITNILAIKLNSWVEYFGRHISNLRNQELKLLQSLGLWYSLLISGMYFFPTILMTTVLSIYLGFGN